jgi:aminopeptidase N
MPKTYNLSDYKVCDYLMSHVALQIDVSERPVQSKATLTMKPNPKANSRAVDMVLDGENMTLTSIAINGKTLTEDQYEVTPTSLILKNVPQDGLFTVETTTLLGDNPDLFGLYETEGTILVKAETEGLRRVFYCNDRPDNLATYETTIIANEIEFPVLLSNGVETDKKILPGGLHSVTWTDDVPKPSYLFALIAGTLERSVAHFTTRSGRDLPIEFYVPPAATPKCNFAKEVLQKAMAWDERTYNLECGLRKHMVAGVDKYASGASEPTGLNLFNTANLFATLAATTDMGIMRVLEVVAHEFFHYWSGDRVTIRDWFNLPVKEGLTTFRAAMFREELFGTDLVRLIDGKNLDPSAPRQSSYTAVRSLYTAAAYEKSADIFRMMMLTVGKDLFYQAMNEFFTKHDGDAVTLENLLDSLTQSTGVNFQTFLPWFTESGIPELNISDEYNEKTRQYTLKVKTIDGKARPIPLVMGLLDEQGKEIRDDMFFMIDEPEMVFTFSNIASRPTPSLLRSFSAPVHLRYEYSREDLLRLIRHDSNIYNRSEAAKRLFRELVNDHCNGKPLQLSEDFFNTFRSLLADKSLNSWLQAEILTIPSEEELVEGVTKPDFEKIAEARGLIQTALAVNLKEDLFKKYNHLQMQDKVSNPEFSIFDIQDAGNRRLKALCTTYFKFTNPEQTAKFTQLKFRDSLGHNMTDTLSSLALLCDMNDPDANQLLGQYYDYWKGDASAVNYWFGLQASSHSSEVVNRVKSLMSHPPFDLSNPNNVYSLLRPFIKNPYGFHTLSGDGYQLIADAIISLDKINPPLAGNLTQSFINWDNYDIKRQQLMLEQLRRINLRATSADVRNIVKKGLDKAKEEPPLSSSIRLTLHGRSIPAEEKDNRSDLKQEMNLS